MIYSNFIFPIKQRIFWINVKKKLQEWNNLIRHKNQLKIETSDRIYFNLYKEDLLSPLIYAENFEWAEKEWLSNYLKPGMVFYDIGANIGFYTLFAAKCVGDKGKVYSLEPSSLNFQRLKSNIELNPLLQNNISIYNIALSDKKGISEIYVSKKDYHAWNSMSKPLNISEFVPEKINIDKLDNLFIENNWLGPNVIKIDIEGWEEYALRGATIIISKYHPTILIEFTKEHLKRTNSSYNNLISILKSYGYKFYEYQARNKKLIPVLNWDFEHKNIIAIFN